MTAFLRRYYAGGGATTALAGSMGSSDTSFLLVADTGWPASEGTDFIVVVDRGTASEEKILCSGNVGTTVSVVTRGYDGTSATTHNVGATVSLCGGAIDFDETNQISHLLGNMTSGQTLFGGGAGTLPTVGAFPPTGLFSTSKSSDYSAVDGDLVLVTASSTITLPAPADAAIVGVYADYAATNSSKVTIATDGGDIFGSGVAASATSIILGAQNAMAILTSDGTNWFITQGAQDTGWITPSLLNSWAQVGVTQVPIIRLRGNQVFLGGTAEGGSNNTEMFAIPTSCIPTITRTMPAAGSDISVPVSCNVKANSGGTFVGQYASTITALSIDGISYLID